MKSGKVSEPLMHGMLFTNNVDMLQASLKKHNIVGKLQENASDLDNRYIEASFQTDYRMNKFTSVLHSDVKEIVASVPAKSCKLDPIPTSLLKMYMNSWHPPLAILQTVVLKQEYSLMSLKMHFCVLFINILASTHVWKL